MIFIRDMVKLFPLGNLEPMAGPTILPRRSRGRIVGPAMCSRSPRGNSFTISRIICFIHLIHIFLLCIHNDACMRTDDLVLYWINLPTSVGDHGDELVYCKIRFKHENFKVYSLCCSLCISQKYNQITVYQMETSGFHCPLSEVQASLMFWFWRLIDVW